MLKIWREITDFFLCPKNKNLIFVFCEKIYQACNGNVKLHVRVFFLLYLVSNDVKLHTSFFLLHLLSNDINLHTNFQTKLNPIENCTRI
jgi:hypothetical protein